MPNKIILLLLLLIPCQIPLFAIEQPDNDGRPPLNPDLVTWIEGVETASQICSFYQEWRDAGTLYGVNKKNIPTVARRVNLKLYAEQKGITNWNTAIALLLSDVAIFDQEFTDNRLTMIYLPEGEYQFESTVNISRNNIVIKGDGFNKTTLKFKIKQKVHLGSGAVEDFRYDFITISNRNRVGFEDFTITSAHDYKAGFGADGTYSFRFSGCTNSYIRSVKSYMATTSHVGIGGSTNCEIRDSWFEESTDCGSGGNGYGISISYGTTKCKFENNLFSWLRHAMIFSGDCSYNVLSYNYSRERRNDETGGIKLADICIHGHSGSTHHTGPTRNLIEGNISKFINFDCYWGENGRQNYVISNIAEDQIRIESPTWNLNEFDCDEAQQKDQHFFFNWTDDLNFSYTPTAAKNNWEKDWLGDMVVDNMDKNLKTRSLIYSHHTDENNPIWWSEEMSLDTFPFDALAKKDNREAISPVKQRFKNSTYIRTQGFTDNNINLSNIEYKYEKLSGYYKANKITFSNNCKVENATSSTISAKNSIVFKPGLIVNKGAYLKAKID